MKRLIFCLLFVAACSKEETVTTSNPSTDAYPQPTATASDPVTPTYTAPDTTTIATNTAPLSTTTTTTAMPVPPTPVPSILRQPPAVDMSSVPNSAAPRISLADTQEKLASGEAVLVDVRLPGAYAEGHAKGAINVPATEVASHLAQLPRDKMIITYCT